MSAVARWCFRPRFVVIAAWVVVLVGLGAPGQAVKSTYDTSFSLPGTGPWQGFGALCLWTALLLAAAGFRLARRDA